MEKKFHCKCATERKIEERREGLSSLPLHARGERRRRKGEAVCLSSLSLFSAAEFSVAKISRKKNREGDREREGEREREREREREKERERERSSLFSFSLFLIFFL